MIPGFWSGFFCLNKKILFFAIFPLAMHSVFRYGQFTNSGNKHNERKKMTFAILEESELPNSPASKGPGQYYPWHELKVGQGFVVPKGAHKSSNACHVIVRGASTRHGKTFKARKQTNGDFVIKRTA